jgi:eukaryotic-like serine/threonine-protein kinase
MMDSLSERLYSVLLYLYPSDFRQEYGADMSQIFRDMHRDAQSQGILSQIILWGHTLSDVITSAMTEHSDSIGQEIMTTIKIDQYEVVKHLENGATSSIYLVKDPENQRDVIMKLWQPEGDFGSDTLKREVDTMIQLKHANIPEVYGYVANEDHPYFLMEYIPGDTLLKQLETAETFIEEETIIAWATQLCDILTHFHNHQPKPYVFRDVKPANIIVDEAGELHLIDFGITVPQQANYQYDLIGTEGYSAPEQYKGIVDSRSDIFALGASLHHIATRIDPRPDHNPKAQIFTFAPAQAINPKLSKPFAAIISKATAYDPEDRFQSAQDLKEALLACAE